ncbi:MAG TPA: type II CAAX endopeptidase family protein, partial [Candidatus Paceibacterota bacterium]|nr:type II CAAX endopeptidase family protein [Candidatus Paceibacterota bacterium]
MTQIILEIFIVFILPVLLLYWKVISVEKRLRVLYAMNLAALLFIVLRGWDLKKLGIRFDNFTRLLPIYALFTITGIVILFLSAIILNIQKNKEKKDFLFIWHCTKISVLQETIYRGYLMPLLGLFFGPVWTILLNSILFTYVHVIYQNKKTTLGLAFIAGISFATIYSFYPNLILISMTHIIFNYVAVSLGFFKLPQ